MILRTKSVQLLVIPLKYKNKEVDKDHIVMEAQQQNIKDKVLEVPKEYHSPLNELLMEFQLSFL